MEEKKTYRNLEWHLNYLIGNKYSSFVVEGKLLAFDTMWFI